VRPALRRLRTRRDAPGHGYGYAYLDETTKREVRRALLKAVCLPGRPVPFASREMPVARGWGSGGLQVTLSVIEPGDVVRVVDQGADESLNAVALRDLVQATTGVRTTTSGGSATLIQVRDGVPEDDLREGQVVVIQVPVCGAVAEAGPAGAPCLCLSAAGREAAVCALPPYTTAAT
jgi:alpha-D-ribose 1-methylphosphonate 5-phosphate C-P lyase